ncbi:MAG: amidohydrolase family protein [Pseudomonadota bacterium]|nr:amidohydrolase family protein [Pseudomonadota bacterium]
MKLIKLAFTIAISSIVSHSLLLAQESPDQIFLNGKIATVDDFFSISEAVAIKGERILAVGTNEEIESLSEPSTPRTDLDGRTVIPGLIDNHNHVVRATEYWPNEARLDGVTSRSEALEILNAKAETLASGNWLMSLGGWSEAQFIDSQADFTLAELDAVAPERPAFIQSVYHHAFGNTAWFNAMGIPLNASQEEQSAAVGLAAHVVRDVSGQATGRLNGGFPMIELALQNFPPVSSEQQIEAIKSSFTHLNSIGLTTVYDPAGVGIRRESYARLREIALDSGLTVRIYHTLGGSTPRTPQDARELIAEIERSKPFQGNSFVDLIAVGEIYYTPFHWDNTLRPTAPESNDIAWARQILIASAQGGWSVQTHATQPETIDYLLNLVAEVNQIHPVRQLRWSITHADNINAEQLERARHLGMNIQLRSNMVMGGRTPIFEEFGDAAYDMPPLRMVQNSGVSYGLGTDGTKAAQINPFVTLWWAVTGKALNGEVIQHQTLTREEALIATTRANALLMFQEQNIGAIKPGLLADMLVLDRDYFTVPADEIKDIRPVATIVGGRIVYGSL